MSIVDERVRSGRLGDSITRPDGTAKVQGSFAFSGDLNAEHCLWGATLRSPHPYARIVSIDVTPAYAISGVEAIITAADVPGQLTYGLISQDQPVFASEYVRYVGEPIAAVAADHPETCRRALQAIVVEFEIREELSGNVCRCTGYGRIIEAVQRVSIQRTATSSGRSAES